MTLDALVDRMATDLDELTAAGDRRRYFHGTYLRTTRAVAAEIVRGGFHDNAWLTEWDLVFAQLYLDALAAGDAAPQPWRVAFDTARHRTDLPPLRHVLLGMNAHINYDLPQALLAVIPPEDFDDPELLRRRAADHAHVDEVLLRRVDAEEGEMGEARPSLLDRLLRPANRVATKRLLVEAREKVWRNTMRLDQARRQGERTYAALLSDLESRAAAKLTELTEPGQVLLKLARRGFGILLPPSH